MGGLQSLQANTVTMPRNLATLGGGTIPSDLNNIATGYLRLPVGTDELKGLLGLGVTAVETTTLAAPCCGRIPLAGGCEHSGPSARQRQGHDLP